MVSFKILYKHHLTIKNLNTLLYYEERRLDLDD